MFCPPQLANTVIAEILCYSLLHCAGGETVDTPALGAGAARHGGSSPLPRTMFSSSPRPTDAVHFSQQLLKVLRKRPTLSHLGTMFGF